MGGTPAVEASSSSSSSSSSSTCSPAVGASSSGSSSISSSSSSRSPAVATSSRNNKRKQGLARALPVDGTTRYYKKRSETISVSYEQVFAECLDHQTQEKAPGQDPYFLIHGSVYDFVMAYGS